jgi:hypothetical protein
MKGDIMCLAMYLARAIRYSACGCLLLLVTDTAMMEPDAGQDTGQDAGRAVHAMARSGEDTQFRAGISGNEAASATGVAAANAPAYSDAPATGEAQTADAPQSVASATEELAADKAADLRSPTKADDCATSGACVDQYLWSLYERTPKIDTVGVSDRRQTTVKRKGKTRTVTTTVTRLAEEDFGWKDLTASGRTGLSPVAYVIGGMDPAFRLTLYHALRMLDDAGLAPGITSAFRDDYRQEIATGLKARTDRSYHGGSSRGGYGHGLAADLVSVKGATRAERLRSSQDMWTWIDAHEKELGIGRPYRDRDPPHVGPLDGQEYADHRGLKTTRLAEATPTAHLAEVKARKRLASAKPTTRLAEVKARRHRQSRHDVRRAGHPRMIASSKPETTHIGAHRSAAVGKGRGGKST